MGCLSGNRIVSQEVVALEPFPEATLDVILKILNKLEGLHRAYPGIMTAVPDVNGRDQFPKTLGMPLKGWNKVD